MSKRRLVRVEALRATLGAWDGGRRPEAAPVLRGVPNPMPWRVRTVAGGRERVAVPPPAAGARPGGGGSRYALAALARECAAVAATPAGGGDHGRWGAASPAATCSTARAPTGP